MSPRTDHDDSVLADDLARIIAACERFEADWKAGRPGRIEEEMAAASEPIRVGCSASCCRSSSS